MKPYFPIFAACVMLMAMSTPAKAQAVFGAYLHVIEEEALAAEARAWAAEAEAWAATVRANVSWPDAEEGKITEDNHSAWREMISRTQELAAMHLKRASVRWDFSDTLFTRKRASAWREDVSRVRANAVLAQQMALGAQEKENMARAQSDSLRRELGNWWWERSGGSRWEHAAEAHDVANEAWSRAAVSWEWAARSLEYVSEDWDEALPIEVSDLFDVLQEHLTPEGVIVLVWEDLPLYPMADVAAFQNIGAFNFSGDINEHVQFGQFIDMEDLWATDELELGEYLLEVSPGCRVNADAPPGSEVQQDFVACLISFLSFSCPPGVYIFKINNEYHAYSSNIACATHD